jgi:hypothetical protein
MQGDAPQFALATNWWVGDMAGAPQLALAATSDDCCVTQEPSARSLHG